VVELFWDIRDFTGFAEPLSSYDVMFVLNRYFYQMGEVIERNGGYIDNFIGDETMVLFGIEDDDQAPLRAVKAALECSGRSISSNPIWTPCTAVTSI
jgi:class 3 adenylate cyclase